MNCQTCRIEIEEMEMHAHLSEKARAHLSVCQVCRAFHDERQSLKRLVGSLEAVTAPADFDFRLRARINAVKSAGGSRSSWRSFLASAPAIGLAASFALLVAAVVIYNQFKRVPTAAPQPSEIAQQAPNLKPEQESSLPVSTSSNSDNANGTSSPDVKDDKLVLTADVKRPRSRTTGKSVSRPRSTPAKANDSQRLSNEFASNPAPVITPGNHLPLDAGGTSPVAELSVRSASQPMRVSVDDRGGMKRTVTLEPVIFGSQDLTGRNTSRMASSQGIW
jgi:hypothetical protein